MNINTYSKHAGINRSAVLKKARQGVFLDREGRTWTARQTGRNWSIEPASSTPPEPSAIDPAAAGDHIVDVDTAATAPALDLGLLKAKLTLEQIRQLQARNAIRRQRLLKDWSSCLERAARQYYAALAGSMQALRLNAETAQQIDAVIQHSAGELEKKLQSELDAYEAENSDRID